MFKFVLITMMSLKYLIMTPDIKNVDNDYLYELKWSGSHHDAVWIWKQSRGDKFTGYRHEIKHNAVYAKVVDEISGANNVNYQEIGWSPILKDIAINDISAIKIKADISLRTNDFNIPAYSMGGFILEAGRSKIGYKTDFAGRESFILDMSTRFSTTLFGKGIWYMPSTYYTMVDGDPNLMITQTVGFDW